MKITHSIKAADAKHEWYVVDATDVPLGRLATTIALRLRGKHKATYTPHVDNGDHIVVINADKVKLTGHKAQNMKFHYHTGFIGGLKTIIAGDELKGKYPERVIQRAVERMLPKDSPLARRQMTHLKIYAGTKHPQEAQNPTTVDFAAMNPKNKRSA